MLHTLALLALLQATPALVVEVDPAKPLALSASDLASLPRVELRAGGPDEPHVYAGVNVTDLLRRAGLLFGRTLRGPALAQYLLAEGGDGYRVVFGLTEFDPDFTDSLVVVADTMDGKPLPAGDGPLRLIVAREKRGARWVRGVKALRVKMAP